MHEQQREWDDLFHKLQPWLQQQGAGQADWYRSLALARSRVFAAPFPGPLPLSALLKAAGALQAAVIAAGAAAAAHGGAWAPAAGAVEVLGLAALAAAAAQITRTAGEQQQYVMCPLIDLINHSSASQV